MAAFLMMLAAAVQTPRAAPPAHRVALTRTGEYLAYRLCLQKTARGAYDAGITPEVLLPELARACATERATLVRSPGFRARMAPAADAQAEDALLTNLTSPFVAIEIRNYMYRYATGSSLGHAPFADPVRPAPDTAG